MSEAVISEIQKDPITRVGLSLFIILAGSFMAPLLVHSSTLSIPSMAADLRLNAETISWFTLVQVLGSSCLVLPAGKLSDIYGRKRIFCVGMLIAGVACLIGGTAQGATALILSRCLQGIGGAFIFGSALALVSSIPPKEHKARVMGIYVAVAYLGIVMGPLFGGVVLKYLTWRWVFFVPGAVLLLIGLVGLSALHWERYGDRDTRLRLLDTSIYMASLGMIALAVFETHTLNGQLLLLAGLLAFAAFCWFQTKRRDPLLQVSLFADNSVYALLGITNFITYCAILALPFTTTLYLQYIQAIDAQTTGLVLTAQAIFTAAIAPASGWLADRLRVRTLLIVGMLIMILGAVCFTMIEQDSSLWLVVIGLSLIGLGVGITDTQIINTALGSVDEKMLGSASATINGLRTMGGFVGIGMVSYLMSRHLGENEIVPELYPDLMKMLQSYFMLSAILVIAAFAVLLVGILIRAKAQRRAR